MAGSHRPRNGGRDDRHESLPPFRLGDLSSSGPTSVGDTVYEQILATLQQGLLQPGERLHDADLAAQLGVSRTPVREALLRLRQIGVVEFAPARYTRVAVVDRAQTRQAIAAWATLYAAIASEAASTGLTSSALDAMTDAHARYAAASRPFDHQRIFESNADFYAEPAHVCTNPLIVRLAESVAHLVRLGLLQLPPNLNPRPLHNAQAELLTALRAKDPLAARQAVHRITEIPI